MMIDGMNVEVVVYDGSSSVMATAAMSYLEKSIELKTHIPFLDEMAPGKYIIATAVEVLPFPHGRNKVIMKGVIMGEKNEELPIS